MGYGDPAQATNTTNVSATGDAKAIIDFADARCTPEIMHLDAGGLDRIALEKVPVYVNPRTGTLESTKALLEAWRTRPERRAGKISVSTIESFVSMVNRDANEDSVIFADNGPRPKLTAVLNFHGAGAMGDPNFCDDVIEYAFPLSDEWAAWLGRNGEQKKMDQATFSMFIEDRYFDIAEPGSAGAITAAWAEKMGVKLAGPAELMRVSRGLSIRVEETVRNVIKRESGECDFVFTVENKDATDGGSVKVPAAFHIRIPILRNEGDYSIPVRLRYRAGGGKVQWFFEMHRPETFLLDAVNEAIERVKAPEDAADPASRGCGLMVVMGTPPSAQG